QRIVDVLLRALARAAPDRVPAASAGSMNNVALGGAGFAYYETLAGGAGAGPHGPGLSAVHTHMTNTMNTPIEALEAYYPLRVRRYAVRRGSASSLWVATFRVFTNVSTTVLTRSSSVAMMRVRVASSSSIAFSARLRRSTWSLRASLSRLDTVSRRLRVANARASRRRRVTSLSPSVCIRFTDARTSFRDKRAFDSAMSRSS